MLLLSWGKSGSTSGHPGEPNRPMASRFQPWYKGVAHIIFRPSESRSRHPVRQSIVERNLQVSGTGDSSGLKGSTIYVLTAGILDVCVYNSRHAPYILYTVIYSRYINSTYYTSLKWIEEVHGASHFQF